MTRLTTAELVVAVEAHALTQDYEKSGWDFWLETFNTADKEELLAGCRSVKGAIKKATAECKLLNDQRDEVSDEPKSGSVIKPAAKRAYGKEQSCGDQVANAIKSALAADISLQDIGAENDVDAQTRWGHLNPGMQRMNLGNVLRAKIKKDQPVTVNGTQITS